MHYAIEVHECLFIMQCCYCQASLGVDEARRIAISDIVVVDSSISPEFDEELVFDYRGVETELRSVIPFKMIERAVDETIAIH